MTELKKDSQSIRTVQTQPSTRKRVPKSTAAKPETPIDPTPPEDDTEAVAKPKRRAATKTTTKTTTKTKRQATSKASQTAASTQVKLAWELSQSSIAARFAQLEHELEQLKTQATHINQQSSEILTEMDQLREISQKIQAPDRPLPSRTRLSLPLEPTIAEEPTIVEEPTEDEAEESVWDSPVPQSLPRPQETPRSQPIYPDPARYATASRNTGLPRRRRSDRWRIRGLLRVPQKPAGVAIDATLWVLAAAGLRIALKYAALQVPILAIGVNVLIFVPAIGVAYLALFVPQVNRGAIYRLLLVTLGLILGGLL